MDNKLKNSRMFKPGSLFLHEQIGEASSDVGAYRMLLINGYLAGIKSENTGQTFVFSWDDLLNIAIEAGVDTLPKMNEKAMVGEKLIPCPHCGGAPVYKADDFVDGWNCDTVHCKSCGAKSDLNSWNKRVSADAFEQQIKGFKLAWELLDDAAQNAVENAEDHSLSNALANLKECSDIHEAEKHISTAPKIIGFDPANGPDSTANQKVETHG